MARTKTREVKRKSASTAPSKGLGSSTPNSRAGPSRIHTSPPIAPSDSDASSQSSSDGPSAPPPTGNRRPLPRGQFTSDVRPKVWMEEDGSWVVERREGDGDDSEYEYDMAYLQRVNVSGNNKVSNDNTNRNGGSSISKAQPSSGNPSFRKVAKRLESWSSDIKHLYIHPTLTMWNDGKEESRWSIAEDQRTVRLGDRLGHYNKAYTWSCDNLLNAFAESSARVKVGLVMSFERTASNGNVRDPGWETPMHAVIVLETLRADGKRDLLVFDPKLYDHIEARDSLGREYPYLDWRNHGLRIDLFPETCKTIVQACKRAYENYGGMGEIWTGGGGPFPADESEDSGVRGSATKDDGNQCFDTIFDFIEVIRSEVRAQSYFRVSKFAEEYHMAMMEKVAVLVPVMVPSDDARREEDRERVRARAPARERELAYA